MTRKIIHIDMDAFYASIEQRDRPRLRGLPVVVGHHRAERAVVVAASYEARVYGIRSAMPMIRAWHLCPDLQVVSPDGAKYREVSRQLRAILDDYTDIIEPLALDECFMDVTQDLKGIGSATWIAQELRARVWSELELRASAGAAPVKFVAKLASDQNKPDGLCVVPPEQVLGFIHPLPVERLWGVGPATAVKLHQLGLRRIQDIARCDPERLTRALGSKGKRLFEFAHGRDERVVRTSRVRKSRGVERTFSDDLMELYQVINVALAQLERLCIMLQGFKERPRCLTLKLRYDDFTTITRSLSVPSPTSLYRDLAPIMEQLVLRTQAGHRPVRLVGVSVSGFDHAQQAQPNQLGLGL